MYRKRTEKMMLLVHSQSGSNMNAKKFENKICNVALSPVRKINILSDVVIKSGEDKINKDGSDISSPPPEITFTDFEVSTPSDTNNEKELDIFDDEAPSPFDDSDNDPSYSPSLEVKKRKPYYNSLFSDSSGSSKRNSSNCSQRSVSNNSYNDQSLPNIKKRYRTISNKYNLYPKSTKSSNSKSNSRELTTKTDNSSILNNIPKLQEDCSRELIIKTDNSMLNDIPKLQEGYVPHLSTENNMSATETKLEDNCKHLCLENNLSATETKSPENTCIEHNLSEKQNGLKKTRSKKRKRDFCYFCENEVLNFARHIQRNHSLEVEVSKLMALLPHSEERRDLINKLRKKGNYLKNVNGYFKPARSPLLKNRNLSPCSTCFGFYSSKLLHRHVKKCNKNKSKSAQTDSQNLLVNSPRTRIDTQLKNQVFPHMRPDKISLEAKTDGLICAFGARYLKTHRERHFIQVTSRKMRELSRLLLIIKKKQPMIANLFQALQPQYFEVIIESTKEVAKFDKNKHAYNVPTYAMNIATSLKQCCEIAITLYLTKKLPSPSTGEVEANLKNMIHLLTTNWRFEVSSQAGCDLNIQKWNKVTIVPLANDLKKLKEYLIEKAKAAVKILKANKDDKRAYRVLLETIYCRVVLLNRKRPGELQRISVHSYLNYGNAQINQYEEFDPIVSSTEKILLKRFKRIVIRGKRGKGVPVLFSADVQEHLDILLSVRPNLVNNDNLYLFGIPDYMTPLTGYKVLEKYARLSGTKNPASITCTKLRKHLATLSQLFSLNETEIDQLAVFMGHTIGVHKNSYRLPDDVHQTAKISKLLLLLEGGNLKEYKGKTLDEIDLNLDEDLLCSKESNENNESNSGKEDEEDNNYLTYNNEECTKKIDLSETNETVKVKNKITRKKRTLESWTTDQKQIVKKYFAEHIKDRKPPKRKECDRLKSEHSQLLENKDWKKIKVFIQNIYTKKQN